LNIYQDDYTVKSDLNKSELSLEGQQNDDLLAKKIGHLLVCFDIYLESESYFLKNNEYQRTKLFYNSVKGRDRKRPYSYLATKDLFTQRP
jgi:hypothetical protein